MERQNFEFKIPLFAKKKIILSWGGFWLVWKTIDVKNGRWKCIMQINSSKCIKKVMWLCAMGRHNLTNQQTDLILQHLKCCYIHSEMFEQSLSSKFFSIIASQKCLTWLRSQTAASTSESNDRLHCVSSARSEAQILYYIWKLLYSPAVLNDLSCQFIRTWCFCSLWLIGWKRCLFVNVLCDIPV